MLNLYQVDAMEFKTIDLAVNKPLKSYYFK